MAKKTKPAPVRSLVTLDRVMRFRASGDDESILKAAAAHTGQMISAYLRGAALAQAIEDLGADDRAEALRFMKSKGVKSAKELR